jgi:ADP-ribose pyrophosphatase YjhB (NUDIX family)
VREFAEETGLRVAVDGVRDVLTDVSHLEDIETLRHQDRLVFDVRVLGGELRPEVGADRSSDRVAWVMPDDLGGLPLMPYAARLLGVATPDEPEVPAALAPWQATVTTGARRHQRFAAYGLVTDPAGRVLLTLIAPGYPGAGRWHLPGGGTDFGESAPAGLLRELVEETGQHGRLDGLISVSHRHHHDAVGPEGVPIDWHGVRVVYRVRVDSPTEPEVTEARGSTSAAGWYEPIAAERLPLTEVARDSVAALGAV